MMIEGIRLLSFKGFRDFRVGPLCSPVRQKRLIGRRVKAPFRNVVFSSSPCRQTISRIPTGGDYLPK